MNIKKRLQIEFEFYGDEQMSANTALKIINNIFEEAENEQLTLTDVSHRTWKSDEIINQLYQFESINEAKRWFKEYGG